MRQAIPRPAGALMVLLVLAASSRGEGPGEKPGSRAAWFKAAKYGAFVHFLPSGAEYQKTVDGFDVEAFADRMVQAGAAYVFLSLGQNSGYYCSPNLKTVNEQGGVVTLDVHVSSGGEVYAPHLNKCMYWTSVSSWITRRAVDETPPRTDGFKAT